MHPIRGPILACQAACRGAGAVQAGRLAYHRSDGVVRSRRRDAGPVVKTGSRPMLAAEECAQIDKQAVHDLGWLVRLHEEGGSRMPCHHALAEVLHVGIEAAGIAEGRKALAVQTSPGHNSTVLSISRSIRGRDVVRGRATAIAAFKVIQAIRPSRAARPLRPRPIHRNPRRAGRLSTWPVLAAHIASPAVRQPARSPTRRDNLVSSGSAGFSRPD